MSKYIDPCIGLESFTCPNCDTLASVDWLWTIDYVSNNVTPNYRTIQICSGSVRNFLQDFFPKVEPSRIAIARCTSCGEPTIWVNGKLVFPLLKGVKPNEDMPEQAKQIFIKVNGYNGFDASITPLNSKLSSQDRVITQGHERLRDGQLITESTDSTNPKDSKAK